MCVGRCKRLFYCLCSGGGTRAPSSSYPIPDEAPPSRLRGCGQKEEVKLKGRSFVGFAERGVLMCRRSERKRNERKNNVIIIDCDPAIQSALGSDITSPKLLWLCLMYCVYTHTIYCYGNGPYWTTKYRISSDPPLNACFS